MNILGNFFMAVIDLINFVLQAYMVIVIARAVISWVNPDPYNPIVRFLRQTTDPVLNRIRRYIPVTGGFDLSPMVLILIIMLLQNFISRTFH
ncbi:MAG: YggT family protein [Desulfobulbus sp.]